MALDTNVGQEKERSILLETPERGISMDQSSFDKTATGTVLSRKLRKLVDSSLETDVETQEALKELSTFFGENTLKNRRQLRGEIERRSLQINLDFLDSFCHVKDALDQVYEEAKAMNASCLAMQTQLKASKSRTQDLISQTTAMQNQSNILAQKAAQIQQFSKRYQLEPEEELLLTGSNKDFYAISGNVPGNKNLDNQPITMEFFEALEKAQSIHTDCRNLLSSGHLSKQTTALEVLDQMSRLQESGLQRLYRWTQSTVRIAYNLDSARSSTREYPSNKEVKNSPSPVHLLPIAIKHLAMARPALFRLVIDEFCTARRSLLVKSFLDALTVGGPYGTPKPIELHAHDPLRYVGDMLAWLHQAVPTEADNLKVLLKELPDDILLEDSKLDKDSININEGAKKEILGKECCVDGALRHITEGTCRPMRSRIEQILVSESAAVVLYKLANLIRFYASTIGNILGAEIETGLSSSTNTSTGLIATLKDLDEIAYKQFISVLQATVQHHTGVDGVLSNSNVIEGSNSGDLSPSHSTSALLALLRETLSSTSVMEEQRDQLEEIVRTVIDPLLNAINVTAVDYPTTDQDVYLLNSLYQIHLTLALFKFNDARLASLESDMQLHLDTLSSEQTSSLIANLGIQPICTMLAQAKSGTTDNTGTINRSESIPIPLSQVSGMDSDSLGRFMAGFDQFLVAPDAFMLPQIRLLCSSSHRKSVAKRSLQVVSATYKQLYEAITDSVNGYVNPETSIVTKTPQQVDLLLQL